MEAAGAGKVWSTGVRAALSTNLLGTCTLYTISRDNDEDLFQLHFLKVTGINSVLQ